MCKQSKRSRKKYTDEYRIAKVKEFLSCDISKYAFCKKNSIPFHSLSKWIRKFVGEEKKEVPMKTEKQPESSEIIRLKRELKEAKLSLYQEKMRADLYDKMIDVAEEMFKIPIRKKAGTKQ